MPLDSSKESLPVQSGLTSKSPKHFRKKRPAHSQAKCSPTIEIRNPRNKKNLTLKTTSESQLKSAMKNKCFEEFDSSFPDEIPIYFCDKFPEIKSDVFSKCANQCKLKRGFSLPTVFNEHFSNLYKSKSCSCPTISLFLEILPPNPGSRSTNLTNTPSSFSNSKTDIIMSFGKGCSSTDELINDFSAAQQCSTSTVKDRTDSVDSTFSQISISEVKEIDETMQNSEPSRITDTKWNTRHGRSKSDASCDFERLENIDEVFSLPNSFSEKPRPQRKSIFEGKQMVVPTECFFPRPQQGQSLTSFFSSNEFNISAELDRENAHFRISEALIAAIEHMKFTRTMKMIEEEEDSDEEIRKLTQRIRIRRSEKQKEKSIRNLRTSKSLVLLSDGKTDTTSLSASPPVSSHSSEYEVDSIGSEEEVDDFELTARTDSNLSSMKENGLSLSMASLYSDADLQKAHLRFKDSDRSSSFQDSDPNNLSAESVALSLIRRFSEKHLPKASDLQWLVSENEVQQKLLPLPTSWPISPDAIEEEYLENTRLRGNFEWAPPRPQIILSILPNLKRKDIMERQKYRCAGCGMKIEKGYLSRFRYCNYFGKYFCQCCHSNNIAYIPGRILWKWDFTKYYVSKFAFELLDQMYSDPLFNVEDVNNKLYQKVRQLDQCRVYRKQLFYLKDFMRTCRKAEGIKELLDKQNHYISHQPHTYSLSDLVQVRSGELVKHLRHLVSPCLEHTKQCALCQAKGFICEICGKEKDIIYPFQLDRVIECQVCGSCFHKSCFKNIKCPRCIRIKERKKRVRQENSVSV